MKDETPNEIHHNLFSLFILDTDKSLVTFLVTSSMSLGNKEKTKKSAKSDSHKSRSTNVHFDLEESQRLNGSQASLEEVDEFLELSTTSNNPSTMSFDSGRYGTTNETRAVHNDGTNFQRNATMKVISR